MCIFSNKETFKRAFINIFSKYRKLSRNSRRKCLFLAEPDIGSENFLLVVFENEMNIQKSLVYLQL